MIYIGYMSGECPGSGEKRQEVMDELLCDGCRWRQGQMNSLAAKVDSERRWRENVEKDFRRLQQKFDAVVRARNYHSPQRPLQFS